MDFRRDRRAGVWVFLCGVALAGPPAGFAQSQLPERYQLADLKALQQAFVELAEHVRPSVVAVRTYQVRKAGDADIRVKVPHSQGSGLVIDAQGLIATNAHVIEGAGQIMVILNNGWRFEASVVQTDVRSDLAVLKIDATDLPVVRFGDPTKLRVNQWVFACGNPFGLANDDGHPSTTYGVVSALGRQMTDRLVGVDPMRYYGDLIETSAAINPGSSGGPLFNIDGEVVGIVTAIETASGVNEGHGFAIPADGGIRAVLGSLKQGRAFRYGYLGVTVDDVDPPDSRRVADSAWPRGAKITRVDPPDGPAARAGLKPNDVVIEFNGMPIEGKDHLVRVVGFTPVGSEVSLTYVRKLVKRKATVTLADRNDVLNPNPTP